MPLTTTRMTLAALTLFACAKEANIGALGSPDSGPATNTQPPNTTTGPGIDTPVSDAGPLVDPKQAGDAATTVTPDVGPDVPLNGVCASAHWCWENPLPQGNDLFGASGTLFVGASGTILERSGSQWKSYPDTNRGDWRSVYQFGSEAWIAGDTGLLHFPDLTMVDIPFPSNYRLNQVWGRTPQDVWTVGQGGRAYHYDGVSWTDRSLPPVIDNPPTFPDLYGVWGAAENDVWVAATMGALAHWDGTAWQWVQADPQNKIEFAALWGTSSYDIWAAGVFYGEVHSQTIYHYDGKVWSAVPPPSGPSEPLTSIWGSSSQDVWAAGYRTNSIGGEIEALIYHYDGTAWTLVQAPSPLTLKWIGRGPDGAVWACGRIGVILRLGSSGFTEISKHDIAPGQTAPSNIDAVWAAPGTGYFAAGDRILLTSDGNGAWTPIDSGGVTVSAPIWGSGAHDIWMGGGDGNVLVHYDGTRFTGFSPAPIAITALWGSGSSDVWAASEFGKLLHWDGSQWNVLDATYPTSSLWGSGSQDIWGTTNNAGLMKHWNGSAWSMVQVPDNVVTEDVAGTAPDDVWVIGVQNGPKILHFDGAAWTSALAGWDTRSLASVWARARNNAWTVGSSGFALHWDGMTWSEVQVGTHRNLLGVWGMDDARSGPRIWVTGDAGTILRYRP